MNQPSETVEPIAGLIGAAAGLFIGPRLHYNLAIAARLRSVVKMALNATLG
jgi:hypothetical protein